jgi:hypothetical protein
MAETPERLAERLNGDGFKTLEFFRRLSPEQVDCSVYTDGSSWKVRQILAHFVSTEKAFSMLIKDVLGGGFGAPEEFEIDRFNENEVAGLDLLPFQDLLVEFGTLRSGNIQLVQGMTLSDMSRMGRHPFLGMTTLEEIVKLLYRHNQIHQRDMRKALQSQSGGSYE